MPGPRRFASATEHDRGRRDHALPGRPVPRADPRRPGSMAAAESNRWRRLFGYEIRLARDPALIVMISPFDFVASNRSFIKILGNSIEPWGLTVEEARAGGVTLSEFETQRFRIDLGQDDAPAVPLVRGTRLVPLEEVTFASVATLQRLLSDYLVRSVQADGRMVYLYHPSRGSEDRTRDNTIRQWMATRSLIRIWQKRGSNELLQTVRKNIEYNLKTMYAEEGEIGLILEENKVKLGAIALAALALTESPFAGEFESIRDRLATTVDLLWRQDGAFRTFYRPAERNDCQNFTPARRYCSGRNESSPRVIPLCSQDSASRSSTIALAPGERNPAFIPWHTQAYCIVWELTGKASSPTPCSR